MRTRQPRQLKPCAFDRLAYKQQLRRHPDAIVKLVGRRSPGRVRAARALIAPQRTQVANIPRKILKTLLRIKGKKKHRISGDLQFTLPSVAHRRMSGAQLSSGSPLDRRFTGPHAVTNRTLVASIPDTDGGSNPAKAGAWYPDALHLMTCLEGWVVTTRTCLESTAAQDSPPPRVRRIQLLFLLFDGCL
jgi:hypothetical protein